MKRSLSVAKSTIVANKFTDTIGAFVWEIVKRTVDPSILALYEENKSALPGLHVSLFPQIYTAPCVQAELLQVILHKKLLAQQVFRLIKISDNEYRIESEPFIGKIITS